MTFPSRRGSKKIVDVAKAPRAGFLVRLSCGHEITRRDNPNVVGATSMRCRACYEPHVLDADAGTEVRNE
jgi:hypothetical protein